MSTSSETEIPRRVSHEVQGVGKTFFKDSKQKATWVFVKHDSAEEHTVTLVYSFSSGKAELYVDGRLETSGAQDNFATVHMAVDLNAGPRWSHRFVCDGVHLEVSVREKFKMLVNGTNFKDLRPRGIFQPQSAMVAPELTLGSGRRRSSVGQPPASSTPPIDADSNLKKLVSMGISEDRAQFALKRSNGNLEAATDFIFSSDIDAEMRKAGLSPSKESKAGPTTSSASQQPSLLDDLPISASPSPSNGGSFWGVSGEPNVPPAASAQTGIPGSSVAASAPPGAAVPPAAPQAIGASVPFDPFQLGQPAPAASAPLPPTGSSVLPFSMPATSNFMESPPTPTFPKAGQAPPLVRMPSPGSLSAPQMPPGAGGFQHVQATAPGGGGGLVDLSTLSLNESAGPKTKSGMPSPGKGNLNPWSNVHMATPTSPVAMQFQTGPMASMGQHRSPGGSLIGLPSPSPSSKTPSPSIGASQDPFGDLLKLS